MPAVVLIERDPHNFARVQIPFCNDDRKFQLLVLRSARNPLMRLTLIWFGFAAKVLIFLRAI